MTGYQGRDNAKPQVAETPELRGSRNKEEIRLHVKKLSDIRVDVNEANLMLKEAEDQIREKQAEFDATELENNAKLQSIQRDVNVAWTALEVEKQTFGERVDKQETYLKERLQSSASKALENSTERKDLNILSGELNDKENKLRDLASILSIRETHIEVVEAEIRKRLRESKELEEQTVAKEEGLKERIKHFDTRSLLVDTKHLENNNQLVDIQKELEKLDERIAKAKIDEAEYERVQKLVEVANAKTAEFNSQRDWIAARNAELKTYEKALRIKDSKIQEREGKVKQAEVIISGG